MVNPLVRVNMRNVLVDYKIKNGIPIEREVSLHLNEDQLLRKIIHGEKGVVEKKAKSNIITLEEAANKIKNGL